MKSAPFAAGLAGLAILVYLNAAQQSPISDVRNTSRALTTFDLSVGVYSLDTLFYMFFQAILIWLVVFSLSWLLIEVLGAVIGALAGLTVPKNE